LELFKVVDLLYKAGDFPTAASLIQSPSRGLEHKLKKGVANNSDATHNQIAAGLHDPGK
jgi:hypothetical protein